MMRPGYKIWFLTAILVALPPQAHAETHRHRLDQDEAPLVSPNLAPDDADSVSGEADHLLTNDKPAAPADAPKPLLDGAEPDLSAPP